MKRKNWKFLAVAVFGVWGAAPGLGWPDTPAKPAFQPTPGNGSADSIHSTLEKGKVALKKGNKKEARKWFEEAAQKGNPEAQYELGNLLWEEAINNEQYIQVIAAWTKLKGADKAPERFKKEQRDALDWMMKSAEQDYAPAEAFLGDVQAWKDYGLSISPEKSLEWKKKALGHFQQQAEQGNVEGEYEWGTNLVYDASAAQREADAKKVKVDPSVLSKQQEGLDWVEKSADQGCVEAEDFLGDAYRNGTWVQKNEAKAFSWYKKAAKQGDSWGTYMVGWCLERGVGCAKDKQAALRWYRKAEDLGAPNAPDAIWALNPASHSKPAGKAPGQEALDKAHEWGSKFGMSPKEQEENSKEYFKWYRIAAEQGNAEAQYTVGTNLIRAADVTALCQSSSDEDYRQRCQKDPGMKEGLDWVRKSAEQGYVQAQSDLGDDYRKGDYVAQDLDQAKAWLRKAADQGYERAKMALKRMKNP